MDLKKVFRLCQHQKNLVQCLFKHPKQSESRQANRLSPNNKIYHPELACPAGVEPATYGLEGLANLQNTMFDNGLSSPDLSVHQNRGGHGVGWGLV